MELLNETECNTISDDRKKKQNTLLEENKQKFILKKKFYNTVFATKMRNRRKEEKFEKLEKLEIKEVLTTCKPVSVDVTRLSSNIVPKVIPSIEHKNRRKKKFQWKLGKTKKKKKIRDKAGKIIKANTKDINEKNHRSENNVDETCLKTKEKLAVIQKLNGDKLEFPGDNDDIQRRKSIRHVTPMMFFDEKWDFETKADNGPIPEEKFSCRRTELFIGKLNTREARILNIEKILREENKPTSQNNNLVDNHDKDVLEKSENKVDESVLNSISNSVFEINKNVENNNSIKSCISIESSKNLENSSKEDHQNKDIGQSIVDTLKNIEMKAVIQESSNLSKEIETKEHVKDEEATCRRTVPFVGKISQNVSPGISERSTEIDFIKSNVKTKSDSSKNMKASNSSDDVSVKLISSKDEDIKTSSSSDLYTELNSSTNNVKSQLDMVLKDENKVNCSMQDVNIKLDSSNETDVKENLCNNVKLDHLSSNVSMKLEESLIGEAKKEIWSCRRIEPYLGKDYPHCSRTLPFIYSVNKVKSLNISGSSTISNDILLSETVTKRLHQDKSDQLMALNKAKNTNIPENQENELINSVIDSAVNIDNNISDTSVQNVEWKFRRKRLKINLDKEQEEVRPSKKCKVKSSSESKPLINKKSIITSASPEKTICSLFSLNCTKHIHHSYNNESPIPHKNIMQDVFVLLTKLEYISDPLVIEYFKKIGFTNKLKKNLPSSKKNKADSDKAKVNLSGRRRLVSRENDPAAKDHFFSINAPRTNFDSNSNNVQTTNMKKVQDEDNRQSESERSISPPLTRPKTRSKRRPLSRSSTESLNIIHSKRKKRPVNYVENFSDSDSTESSLSALKHSKAHLKNRRLTLRDRQKLRTFSNHEIDENDMEVEEFTRIGLRNSTQSKGYGNRNIITSSSTSRSHGAEDSDTFNDNVSSRTASVVQNIEGAPSVQSIDKNSSINLANEMRDKVPNERFQVLEEIEKTVEETSLNPLRLRQRNQGSGVGQLKNFQYTEMTNNNINTKQQVFSRNARTPNLDLEVSSEQSLLMTKTSNNSDGLIMMGKKSKVSRIDEFAGNLRKASSISSRSEKDNSRINGSKPKLNFDHSSTIKQTAKILQLTNLKVQLIKLETVCDSFKDYSASEIELLTRKYIDLLMNSNFTCDTWRNPINYHRSEGFTEKHIEQVDNSDCVSDVESQEESEELLEDIETEDANNTSRIKPVIEDGVNKLIVKTSKQIETKLSSFTTLESAIATLVDAEPGEQRNFGAVNISEALISPSSSRMEKEKEQTVQLNNDKLNNENHEQLETNDKQQSTKSSSTILVNGTTMYPCPACNKIFVVENSLKQHQTIDHKGNNGAPVNTGSTASTIITTTITDTGTTTTATAISKSTGKQKNQVTGSSASKKSVSKCKRKFRYSESLKCTICSVTFDTRELLFDHIMTHNEQELQEAYKTAKAKAKQQSEGSNSMSEESDKDLHQEATQVSTTNKKKSKETSKRKKSTDSSIRSSRSSLDTEDVIFEDPLRNPCNRTEPITVVEQQEQVIDLACNEIFANIEQIPAGTSCSKPITICQCHAHETTVQDLQIEMVLLCKTCNVVFRRRDCFEVHYRTSLECRRRRTNNEVTKMPKLFCSGCPCVLDSLMDMRAHLEMHARKNSQGTVTFICNICKVAFFGVGGIFYSHWFNHTKAPNFVASRYSFPKLSVVSVLEDSNVAMTTSKSQEGFFYIAEHVCRQCRLPFSSEPELLKHKTHPCQPQQPVAPRVDTQENNRLQMIKLICDLCKKYYVSKENFDRHCSERNHLKTPITKFSRLPINANEQAFVCSLCRAVSKSLDDLKEHWKRIHSPIMELYTCKTCNIVPSNDVTNYTYEKFERHCRIVHKSEVITCLVYFVTARYVCNICRFGFETEKSMKEHQVVHQKRSTQSSNSTVSGMPIEPQTATLWVADKQVAPDGGRKVHPVYVHYPGINGNVSRPIAILPAPVNAQSQNQTHIRSQNNVNANQMNVASNNSVNSSGASNSSSTNSMLRSMLAQRALDQPSQQNSNNSNVETILIDSRSNSPTTDSTALVSRDKSAMNSVDSGVSSRKSYMTMVNPNFESMLGTNSAVQLNESNNDNSVLDKENSNSGGTATPVSMDLLTPQPFEVVLVTDDLSESSNCDSPIINDRSRANVNKIVDIANSNQQKQHQTLEGKEVSSTKSSKFLRVRSIAELQHMKINLCSVCGLSFDTPQAFEQHSQQHENPGEVNRTTPVQMISPMLAQSHKESNDPQNILISQMRHKMALLTPNTKESLNSLNSYNKTNPSVLPNQFQHPQQQQHSYWFASCNGRLNNSSSNMAYNTYNRQPHQQLHHQQQQNEHINQQNIIRRPVNLNTVGSNYMSRGPPPAYPSTSSPMTPSRSSAIQLPERNTLNNAMPTTKRPSGAATRIPQQILPSIGDYTEHRQTGSRMPYTPAENINNTRMMSSTSVRHSQHPQYKSYNRHSGEFNYPSSIGNNSNYHHSQQQHPTKIIYNCKLQSCPFRSENLSILRAHEKNHLNQQLSTMPSNPMQQQQRLPLKHVPVSQMPERTRHAIPTGRPPSLVNLSDKRCTCHVCNFFCNSEVELIDHMAQCHNTPNSQVCCYVCDYCSTPLIFESEDLLRKHMNANHNHSCEFCNKRYPSKEDLMIHMEVHARST